MSSLPSDVTLPDPASVLDQHSMDEINEAMTLFPDDQKQSAVGCSLHVAQHQNKGFLTTELWMRCCHVANATNRCL